LDYRTLELTVYPRGYLCGIDFQDFEKNWSMWFFQGKLYMTYSLVFKQPKQLQTDNQLGSSTFWIKRINNSELSSDCIISNSFKPITPDKIPFLDGLKIKVANDKDVDLFTIIYLSPTTQSIPYRKINIKGVKYLRYIGVGHLKFNTSSLLQITKTDWNTWFSKFIYKHLDIPKGHNPRRKLNEHYGGYIYLWFFYYFDLLIPEYSDIEKQKTIQNTIDQIEYKYGKIVHPGSSTFVQTFPVGLERIGGSFNKDDFKDDDKYIISYGDYDSLCKLLILPRNELDKLLEPHDLTEEVLIIDDIHNNTHDFL